MHFKVSFAYSKDERYTISQLVLPVGLRSLSLRMTAMHPTKAAQATNVDAKDADGET